MGVLKGNNYMMQVWTSVERLDLMAVQNKTSTIGFSRPCSEARTKFRLIVLHSENIYNVNF